MRKLNIILNYFNIYIYIYIYSIHYAYTIVTYYCIGRWINSYAGRNLKVHIRSHQHHPTPYSENMVTSALQDVPDVACILTASMVATWRKWDALRILPMKNPLQGHPMANTLENFHGWNPNAMEVDGQDDLPFSIMWFFSFQPFIFQGCAFNIFQFVWAVPDPQVWEVMSADALLCSDARSLFSASWWRLRVHAPCVYCQWRKIIVGGCLSTNPSVLRMRGDKEMAKMYTAVRRLLD